MTNPLRRLGRTLAIAPWVWHLVKHRQRGRAVILVWHRFSDIEADAVPALDQLLTELRRRRIPVATLRELVEDPARWEDSAPVVFTIDDGYADVAEHAAPIFAKHDCRPTVFLTTGFIDGEVWMWWDRIHYMLRTTERTRPVIVPLDTPYTIDPTTATPEDAERFAEAIEFLPIPQREEMMEALARELEVDVPARPTPTFSPMSWDTIRTLEQRGFDFGPHTRTHPILSTLPTPDELRREIDDSWQRLVSELKRPLPVFCLPNGSERAYGPRERQALQDSPVTHAVSTIPGYTTSADIHGANQYDLPRFPGYFDWRQSMVTVYGYRRLQRHVRQSA